MATTMENAVKTVKEMFQDWDSQAIEDIITANGGNVDAAVVAILAMESAGPVNIAGGGQDGVSSSMLSDEQLARSLAQGYESEETPREGQRVHFAEEPPSNRAARTRPAPQQTDRRGRRVALPDDFLRVEGLPTDLSASGTVRQMSDDEQLALMLQNEMFLRQLEADPVLSSLSRYGFVNSPESGRQRTEGEDSSIQKQLTEMGEGVRKRFNDFVQKFKRTSNQAAEGGDAQSSAPLIGGNDSDNEGEFVSTRRRNNGATSEDQIGIQMHGTSQGYYDDDEEQLSDPRSKKTT